MSSYCVPIVFSLSLPFTSRTPVLNTPPSPPRRGGRTRAHAGHAFTLTPCAGELLPGARYAGCCPPAGEEAFSRSTGVAFDGEQHAAKSKRFCISPFGLISHCLLQPNLMRHAVAVCICQGACQVLFVFLRIHKCRNFRTPVSASQANGNDHYTRTVHMFSKHVYSQSVHAANAKSYDTGDGSSVDSPAAAVQRASMACACSLRLPSAD